MFDKKSEQCMGEGVGMMFKIQGKQKDRMEICQAAVSSVEYIIMLEQF